MRTGIIVFDWVLYGTESQRFANVARDKSLPVTAEPEFNGVAGTQIADGHRVIHMMSTEKKAINIADRE
jgi:hypothetical protein